jgi:hypothetical protein
MLQVCAYGGPFQALTATTPTAIRQAYTLMFSDMRLRLGPRPSRRIAYAMLLGEGLAARSAGFGLDRVN